MQGVGSSTCQKGQVSPESTDAGPGSSRTWRFQRSVYQKYDSRLAFDLDGYYYIDVRETSFRRKVSFCSHVTSLHFIHRSSDQISCLAIAIEQIPDTHITDMEMHASEFVESIASNDNILKLASLDITSSPSQSALTSCPFLVTRLVQQKVWV